MALAFVFGAMDGELVTQALGEDLPDTPTQEHIGDQTPVDEFEGEIHAWCADCTVPSMSDEPISAWVETEVGAPLRDLDAAFVEVAPALAAALATRHSRVFSTAAIKTGLGDESLTADIPNAKPEHLAVLGADGLVAEGTEVGHGSILIGKVTPKAGAAPSAEEKLLRAIFGETASEVRDTSLRCPPGCAGFVEEARMVEPQAKDELARAEVVVGWDRPLVVGDELSIAASSGVRRVVIAGIRELGDGVSLAWAGEVGHLRVAKLSMVDELIHARSIGPYSLVTQQPLGRRAQFGGQSSSARQLAALASEAPWAAWEMFSIKSDSVTGRMRAYESLVRRADIDLPRAAEPETGSPNGDSVYSFFEKPPAYGRPGDPPALPGESVQVLERELAALAIETRLSAAAIGARLRTSAELRERSQGEVKKPETINYRTYMPERDGLFCARIFGPVRDYACLCGKYDGMRHRGVVCEKCGVEVIASKVRRERFGHVELPVPVAHPLFRPALAEALGISPDELDELIAGRAGFDRGGALRSMEEAADDEELELATGGWGLRQALDNAGSPSGGVSLDQLLLEVVPVLPPDLRPLVPLEGGRFATSDLNDLYRRVVNRRNRLARLIELNAPAIILHNESAELQRAVDQLFDNERQAKPAKYQGKALQSLARTIEAHFGDLVRRRVDYSGETRFIADPELGSGRIRLPWRMAVELYKPMAYGILEQQGYVSTIKSAKTMVETGVAEAMEAIEAASREVPVLLANEVALAAREVELWDEAAIAVDPSTARLLRGEVGLSAVCVHLPLSSAARRELEAFEDVALARELEVSPGGWFSAAVFEGEGTARVVEAALGGARETLSEPLLRAALGRGPDDGERVVTPAEVVRRETSRGGGGSDASEDDYDF